MKNNPSILKNNPFYSRLPLNDKYTYVENIDQRTSNNDYEIKITTPK